MYYNVKKANPRVGLGNIGMVGHYVYTLLGLSGFILLTLSVFRNIGVKDVDSRANIDSPQHTNVDAVMKTLRESEKSLVSNSLNISLDNMSESDAMVYFYKTISQPLQGVCNSLKRVGGKWIDLGYSKAVDGDKFICMDDFHTTDDCLIYSFGIRFV